MGKTVADNFLKEIDKRLDTLSEQPFIGVPCDEAKTVRSILKLNITGYTIV